MDNKKMLIIGGIFIILVLGITQFFLPLFAVSPTLPSATSTPEQLSDATPASIIATTTVHIKKPSLSNPLLLVDGDAVASWDFEGAYASHPELIVKAEAEITRLSDFLGKGVYTDMALYVAIANQYELLGNGKQEYDYLGRAIEAGGTGSGLPWHNLGVLMERLGALKTARVTYEKATLIQPELKFYHYAYFEFLTTRMRDDTADIEKAFATAIANLGQDADILQLHSEWEKS